MKTAEEILIGAAEGVESGGWTQHALHHSNGKRCMMGWLLAATEMTTHDWVGLFEDEVNPKLTALRPVFLKVLLAVEQEIDHEAIPMWNDMAGRTAEEVSTALRNAVRWVKQP